MKYEYFRKIFQNFFVKFILTANCDDGGAYRVFKFTVKHTKLLIHCGCRIKSGLWSASSAGKFSKVYDD